jgi:hypothetical protein
MTAKLRAPKFEGKEAVGGKDAPVLRLDQDQQQLLTSLTRLERTIAKE